METSLIDGDLSYRQHSSGHTPVPSWPTFITFASRYIHAPWRKYLNDTKAGRFRADGGFPSAQRAVANAFFAARFPLPIGFPDAGG
jgi:hypothetical protein